MPVRANWRRISTHLIAQNRWDGSSMANLLDWRDAERRVRRHDLLPPNDRQCRHVCGHRRTAARAGRAGRARSSSRCSGTPPLIGRTFSPEEFDRAERVVVLSEGLWQEQFAAVRRGARPDALDRRQGPRGDRRHAADVPAAHQRHAILEAVVRSAVVAGDDIDPRQRSVRGAGPPRSRGPVRRGPSRDGVIAARLREAHAVNRNLDIRIVPAARSRRRQPRRAAACGSALPRCCACSSSPAPTSAACSRRERPAGAASWRFAQRSARGGPRLVRQLLAEGVSLWAVASVAGVLLAYGLIRLLLAYGPRALPRMEDVGLDVAALAVAFLGGLVVVIACGTIPGARGGEGGCGGGVRHAGPVEPSPRPPAGPAGHRADRRGAHAPRGSRALRAELPPRPE